MKIEINLKVLLVSILCLIIKNIDTYFTFLFFILIHEISHLLIGVLIGGRPRKIKIEPFGISMEFYEYADKSHVNKILFFLAGPLMNLLIAAVFRNFHIDKKLVYTNVILFLFNMLPILPLDGGKIAKEILEMVFKRNVNKTVLIISKCFLIVISFIYSILIIKIKNIYILLLIIYLWYLYEIEKEKIIFFDKTKKIIDKLD